MRAPLTSNAIQATRLVMNFLALCCNAAPFLNCGAPVSALLSTVAIYASRLETSCLSCHFLIAVSSLDGRRGKILPNKSASMGLHKLTWEVALSCPRSDIVVACKSAYSARISTPDRKLLSVSRILCIDSRTSGKSPHVYDCRDLGLFERCSEFDPHWALYCRRSPSELSCGSNTLRSIDGLNAPGWRSVG